MRKYNNCGFSHSVSILFTHIFIPVLSLLNVACRAPMLVPFVKTRPYDRLIVLASLVKPGGKSFQPGLNRWAYLHKNQALHVWM